MKKSFLLILSIVIITIPAFTQKIPGKFGKPPKEHLKSTACPIDSSAGAYVVYDYGKVKYDYVERKGFHWTLDRHLVIKILKKSEYDKANFVIPIREFLSNREEVTNLKAATYSIENGKTRSSVIKTRDAFEEELTEGRKLFKFTLPNVEENCLIEVSYRLISEFPSYLRDWNFQWDIPVLHSEIFLAIPEYIEYNQNMKGYHPLTKTDFYSGMGQFIIEGDVYGQQQVDRYGRMPTGTHRTPVNFTIYNKHFIANNLPALKDEEFVDNIDNYKTGIEFELKSINFGMSNDEYITGWNTVSKRLLEEPYFGGRLDKAGFASEEINQLKEIHSDPYELMNAILNFTRLKVKWNGSTRFSGYYPIRRIYEEGNGRAADINFILINFLREAGIEAYPVALSTRDHGVILRAFPTMDGLNYAVALAIIDDKRILLDASDPYCPPGILPPRCINGMGIVIDKNLHDWIDLSPAAKFEEMIMYDLNIDESGYMKGRIEFMEKGYAARNLRNKINSSLDMEEFLGSVENEYPGLNILDHEFKGMDEIYGPVTGKYEVEIKNNIEMMGEMLIFNPFMFERITDNPLKLEQRRFPVDLNYPRSYQYMFKFHIPEGYEIESLPESQNMALPDKSAKLLLTATQIGNMVNMNVMIQFEKHKYLPEEYHSIKEFYKQLVAKESEMIVLRKKEI